MLEIRKTCVVCFLSQGTPEICWLQFYSKLLTRSYLIALKFIQRPSVNGFVPDHVGTLAQVGNSPSLGWPNKELRGSQPI